MEFSAFLITTPTRLGCPCEIIYRLLCLINPKDESNVIIMYVQSDHMGDTTTSFYSLISF